VKIYICKKDSVKKFKRELEEAEKVSSRNVLKKKKKKKYKTKKRVAGSLHLAFAEFRLLLVCYFWNRISPSRACKSKAFHSQTVEQRQWRTLRRRNNQ